MDHLHDLLLVILEVSDLSPTRERLMEQWKWFRNGFYQSRHSPEYKKSIQIGGIIRDFKPDCGIRNLKAAIEFKYAAKEEEVARAIGGIFEDVSGYSGSRDWNRFYTVIYQTEPFESEDRVRTELTRAGAITWNLFPVTGSGSRRFKKRKSKTRLPTLWASESRAETAFIRARDGFVSPGTGCLPGL